MPNKKKTLLNSLNLVLLMTALLFTFESAFAQKALKIEKTDGSVTYINAAAIDSISFVEPLQIGDSFQGGIIFDLDETGQHGLIVAPASSETSLKWGEEGVTPEVGFQLTNGEETTDRIIGKYGMFDVDEYAARYCENLTIDGYDDWYLPSLFEFIIMMDQLEIDDFNFDEYWTSNELNDNQAFTYVIQAINSVNFKSEILGVRAIRAF